MNDHQNWELNPLTASNEELLDCVSPWSGPVPRGYFASFTGALTAAPFEVTWRTPEELEEVLSGDRFVTTKRPLIDDESYYEQTNIIRSILASQDKYVMVELGGGYGPRAVDCALQLKKLRPSTEAFYVVVEAVPAYLAWCKHHFLVNGVVPEDHWIVPAIVSADPVPKLFHLNPQGFGNSLFDQRLESVFKKLCAQGEDCAELLRLLSERGLRADTDNIWPDHDVRVSPTLEPVPQWSVDKMIRESRSNHRDFGFVNSLTLGDVLAPLPHVDFLDMDIQCGEATVVPASLVILSRKVRLLSIGTHYLEVHEQLKGLLMDSGWELINERLPFAANFGGDGVLTFLNSRLQD